MNKQLIAIAGFCLLISALSPVTSYFYFNNKFDPIIANYKAQIAACSSQNMNLNQQNANLEEKNNRLECENKQLTNLTEPYLVAQLGWYLHTSSDVVPSSRDSFNIYGTILNIGVLNAENCSLIIGFYDNMTLLQTTTLPLGVINSGSTKTLENTQLGCGVADSVNRIDVTPQC